MLVITLGCEKDKRTENDKMLDWIAPKVVTIERCEYFATRISTGSGGGFALCHKGNCKNPIHKEGK
jgi:hypothetical protein